MKLAERFAGAVNHFAGTTSAFFIATAVIIIWAATGPIFAYSDTWQLIINTGTTIVTFLMVFLIQRSQNKDMLALHTKLDEIIRATSSANNNYINIEQLSEADALALKERLIDMTKETLVNSELTVAETSESVERARAEQAVPDPAQGTLDALVKKASKQQEEGTTSDATTN